MDSPRSVLSLRSQISGEGAYLIKQIIDFNLIFWNNCNVLKNSTAIPLCWVWSLVPKPDLL